MVLYQAHNHLVTNDEISADRTVTRDRASSFSESLQLISERDYMCSALNCSICSRPLENCLQDEAEERLIELDELECRTRIPVEGLKEMIDEEILPVAAWVDGEPLCYWSDLADWMRYIIDADWEMDTFFEPSSRLTEYPLDDDEEEDIQTKCSILQGSPIGDSLTGEPLLTEDEVARRMQVHPDSIADMVHYGGLDLADIQDDGFMYRWSDVVAWL